MVSDTGLSTTFTAPRLVKKTSSLTSSDIPWAVWSGEMSGWWTPDGSWTHVESSPLTPPILAWWGRGEVRGDVGDLSSHLLSQTDPATIKYTSVQSQLPLSGTPATQQANSGSFVSHNTNIGHGVPGTIYTAGHVTLSTHLQTSRQTSQYIQYMNQ